MGKWLSWNLNLNLNWILCTVFNLKTYVFLFFSMAPILLSTCMKPEKIIPVFNNDNNSGSVCVCVIVQNSRNETKNRFVHSTITGGEHTHRENESIHNLDFIETLQRWPIINLMMMMMIVDVVVVVVCVCVFRITIDFFCQVAIRRKRKKWNEMKSQSKT